MTKRKGVQAPNTKRRNRWLIVLLVAFLAISAGVIVFVLNNTENARRTNKTVVKNHKPIPQEKAVWKFFSEIEYSTFDVFNDKDVRLAVNFEKQIWLIKGYFKFDSNNNILLNDNSGACLELAIYAFVELEKDLGRYYRVQFAETLESSTFNNANSRHWVLLLTLKSNGEQFILDPSFKRFGRIDDFDDYRITNLYDRVPVEIVKDGHNRLSIADGAPIFIKKGNLIGLIVRPVNKKFDRNNFSLGIYAKKPFKFKGHFIYNIGLKDGAYFEMLNEENAKEFLTSEQLKSLKGLLKKLYKDIESTED